MPGPANSAVESSVSELAPPAELIEKLESLSDLPTPPNIAAQIIELLGDPDADFDHLIDSLSKDPALVAKVLKTANSATYARRREVTNLGQALLTLGQTATTTLALSFSLVGGLRKRKSKGVDLNHYWRRSLLTGFAARSVGAAMSSKQREELFLAGLLQDIGLLVLDMVIPEHYAALSDSQADHQQLCQHEQSAIEVDHAWIGAWLLERWGIPASICDAVRLSHHNNIDPDLEFAEFANTVSVASHISDVLLGQADQLPIAELALEIQGRLGLGEQVTLRLLNEVAEQLPDIKGQFGVDIMDGDAADSILDCARQLLTDVNLRTLREITELKQASERLQQQSHTDGLTGLRNREFLNAQLHEWFERSVRHKFPLSIAFLDLDGFKAVNDVHGHAAGDEILKTTATLLQQQIRATDTLARFGGDEFVLILGGETAEKASVVCSRILQAFEDNPPSVGGIDVNVRVSIGLAEFGHTHATTKEELLAAADSALLYAKQNGKGKFVLYHDIPEDQRPNSH